MKLSIKVGVEDIYGSICQVGSLSKAKEMSLFLVAHGTLRPNELSF